MRTLQTLLALGTIKGIAQAGDEFTPAEHGLTEKDVAELLACGAAAVLREEECEEASEAPPPQGAAPAEPAKPAKPGKGRAAP